MRGILAAWVIAMAVAPGQPDEKPPGEAKEPEIVALRGRIIDINAELNKRHKVDLGADTRPLYGFKTGKGRIYTLLKTRRSLALFMDDRLQERELILKGRLFPGSQVFEATFIQSVRDGVVHDLYYYCDICAIVALTPEICACCREPVRLVEERVKER